jgi:AraC-like DNA-binding protein
MDKRKKGKIFIIIALLLPLFLIISFVQISLEKPVVLFPGDKISDLVVWTYNDPGKSMINDFAVEEHNIKLQFIHEKPGSFVGIGINLSKYTDFFDFTPYSHIYITLITENIETCSVIIKLFVPGITNMNNSSSFRHFGYNFPIKKDQTEYRCPLSAFRDPFWWTSEYNPGRINIGQDTLKNGCFLLVESSLGESSLGESSLGESSLGESSLGESSPGESSLGESSLGESSLGESSLDNDPAIRVNRESSMTITNISLYKSPLFFYILMGGSTAGYYFLLFVIFWVNKRRRKLTKKGPLKMIEYKKLMVESYREMDLKKVITYFQTKYTDPDISLGKMSHDLGLSPARISSLIKTEFDLTFKQMLNKIRLTEAKRLLKETDRQIIDIAFAIGYNDRSYFYKVFLKNEGMSPSDFRKENS